MMPFPGDATATANGTLLLAAAAAVLYAFMVFQAPSWRRTAVKTISVVLLAALAWLEHGPLLLVAALVFGAAGDAFLSRDGERAFLAGLASFLVAHLLYIALFVVAGAGVALFGAEPWRMVAALVVILFAGAMAGFLWPALPSEMRAPVAAYVVAIAVMGIAALSVRGIGVALGAALFIASDAILATEKFRLDPASPQRRWMSPAVWVLYWTAQATIALAFLV